MEILWYAQESVSDSGGYISDMDTEEIRFDFPMNYHTSRFTFSEVFFFNIFKQILDSVF